MRAAMILTRNLFIIILFAVAGWGDERKLIHDSIRGYTQGIITASKKDNVEHMEPYATEKRAQKLFVWLKSWHENNYFMDSAIDKIEFLSYKNNGKKAVVTTREKWRYRYIQIVTREVTQPWMQAEYIMRYVVLKDGKYWKIDEAEIVSEKQTPLQKSNK